MTAPPKAEALLRTWELGAKAAAPTRAWLMLCAGQPDQPGHALAGFSVGQRDAQLLELREQLFGPSFECVTRCPQCEQLVESAFSADDIRLPHAESGITFDVEAEGYTTRCRLPTCADLIALEAEADADAVRQRLLDRCLLRANPPPSEVPTNGLPESLAARIAQRMAELDPQAEVMLHLTCPHCGHPWHAPFVIGQHLWSEIDQWARSLLNDIHALASRYGWSEADILAMSAVRRQVYLEMLAT